MRFCLRFAIVLTLYLVHAESMAQRAGSVSRTRYTFSVPKVRANKARIICPAFDRGRYPYHGLGFKLGDPFAITYKYYAAENFAFVLDAGRAASGLYRAYYRDGFDKNLAEEEESPASYVGHRVISDWTVDAHILYQVNVSRAVEGLQAYAGGGWSWKRTHLAYDYLYHSVLPDEDPFGSLHRKSLAMGPQLVAGLEYSYFSIPVAAFLEAEYFIDVHNDPGYRRVKGGIGLRYIF